MFNLFVTKESTDAESTNHDNVVDIAVQPIVDEYPTGWTADIPSIYQNFALDENNSIMKVQELLSSLPQELPKNDLKKTLAGICGVAGINISAIINDAVSRQNYLSEYFNSFSAEATKQIEEAQFAIDAATAAIEESKRKIQTFRALGIEISKNIDTEVAVITDLVSYIN